MLSEERIVEIKNKHFVMDRYGENFNFIDFARAIEAAALPEGLVAVPKMPTLAMLDCLRSDITSNLEKRYQAMLAVAPKAQTGVPFKATVIFDDCTKTVEGIMPTQVEKQEPLVGANSGHGHVWERPDGVKARCGGPGICEMCSADLSRRNQAELLQAEHDSDWEQRWPNAETPEPKAENQEQGGGITFEEYAKRKSHLYGPVKDEPVAIVGELYGQTRREVMEKGANIGAYLYLRPQPDLTAEVERLKSMEFDWAKVNAKLTDRIAELEARIPNIPKIEGGCRTLEDWRCLAIHLESQWAGCSYSFNKVAGEQKQRIAELEAEVERLKVKERDCEAQHGDLVRCNRQLHERITALDL